MHLIRSQRRYDVRGSVLPVLRVGENTGSRVQAKLESVQGYAGYHKLEREGQGLEMFLRLKEVIG